MIWALMRLRSPVANTWTRRLEVDRNQKPGNARTETPSKCRSHQVQRRHAEAVRCFAPGRKAAVPRGALRHAGRPRGAWRRPRPLPALSSSLSAVRIRRRDRPHQRRRSSRRPDTPGGVELNLRTHAEPEEGPRLEYLGHRKVARAPSASVIVCGYPLSRDVADQ